MKRFLKTKKARGILNVIFSLGAAIVIFGALAKIEHWGGILGYMLEIGMVTESFVFILMALQPADDVYHWEKFYPNIHLTAEEEEALTGKKFVQPSPVSPNAASSSPLQDLDRMLESADITPTNLQKLSSNFQKLDQTLGQMSDLSNVVAATSGFTEETERAAKSMGEVAEAYASASESMNTFKETAANTENFHEQLRKMTDNLGSLNSLYEMSLQDTDNQMKAMKGFYTSINEASKSLALSVGDAEKTQEQIASLAANLEGLNSIYGNMLSAMKRG